MTTRSPGYRYTTLADSTSRATRPTCRNCVLHAATGGSGALGRDDLDRQVEPALDSMGKVRLQPSGDSVRQRRQDDLVERVASDELLDPRQRVGRTNFPVRWHTAVPQTAEGAA